MPSYANPIGGEYGLAKYQDLFLCSGQNILQGSISDATLTLHGHGFHQ